MSQELSIPSDKIDLIRKTVCAGATDAELELFLHVCQRTKLDPFTRQIYSIKRGNQRTIQTGIDGLRSIAERTGMYSPGKESQFNYDENKRLISATSYVKKMTEDGTWHEVASVAFMSEYNPGQGLWSKMPHVMLSKCAEANALRKAFPQEMCGLYTPEEMEQATIIDESKQEKIEKQVEMINEQKISFDKFCYLSTLMGGDPDVIAGVKAVLKTCDYNSLEDVTVSNFERFEKGIKNLINNKK